MVPTAKEIFFSRTKLPFSKTKYTIFKGNKSRYAPKNHIIFIQCMIDYWHFYGTSSSPLLAVRFTHFYLNFNWCGISRLCMGTLFLLQSKFSSTGIIYIHRLFVLSGFFHRQYIFHDISWFPQIQGHFHDLENLFVIFQAIQQAWEPCKCW